MKSLNLSLREGTSRLFMMSHEAESIPNLNSRHIQVLLPVEFMAFSTLVTIYQYLSLPSFSISVSVSVSPHLSVTHWAQIELFIHIYMYVWVCECVYTYLCVFLQFYSREFSYQGICSWIKLILSLSSHWVSTALHSQNL